MRNLSQEPAMSAVERWKKERKELSLLDVPELAGGNETSETCARLGMICDLSWFVIVAVNGSRSLTRHYGDREVV